MVQKKMELDIINTNCAGIDIGSKSHFVAVGQSLEDVKEFGVYADDLTAICVHLKVYGITSVAMSSPTARHWKGPRRSAATRRCYAAWPRRMRSSA